jgi:phosphatidate cytidylyltransferase
LLKQRALSALVLLPVVLGATYLGGVWFFLVVFAAAMIAGWEYYRLLGIGGHHPSTVIGLILIAALLADARWPGHRIAAGALALLNAAMLVREVNRGNAPGSLAGWELTFGGAIYVGWGAHHFLALRALPLGMGLALLTYFVTWMCDSAAYFVGRWKGKSPFYNLISPRKTREGAIAGIVGGTLTGLVVGSIIGIDWYHGLALGIIGSLGATYGDLAESLIKRQVGVKDSSNLIPGHGGMLDRLDSLLVNVILVYYYAYWLMGSG